MAPGPFASMAGTRGGLLCRDSLHHSSPPNFYQCWCGLHVSPLLRDAFRGLLHSCEDVERYSSSSGGFARIVCTR